jgi:hypothetical protein
MFSGALFKTAISFFQGLCRLKSYFRLVLKAEDCFFRVRLDSQFTAEDRNLIKERSPSPGKGGALFRTLGD